MADDQSVQNELKEFDKKVEAINKNTELQIEALDSMRKNLGRMGDDFSVGPGKFGILDTSEIVGDLRNPGRKKTKLSQDEIDAALSNTDPELEGGAKVIRAIFGAIADLFSDAPTPVDRRELEGRARLEQEQIDKTRIARLEEAVAMANAEAGFAKYEIDVRFYEGKFQTAITDSTSHRLYDPKTGTWHEDWGEVHWGDDPTYPDGRFDSHGSYDGGVKGTQRKGSDGWGTPGGTVSEIGVRVQSACAFLRRRVNLLRCNLCARSIHPNLCNSDRSSERA